MDWCLTIRRMVIFQNIMQSITDCMVSIRFILLNVISQSAILMDVVRKFCQTVVYLNQLSDLLRHG
jgi:hypothetical protein